LLEKESIQHPPEASFFTQGWIKFAITIATTAIIIRIDEYFNGEKDIHPISALIKSWHQSYNGQVAIDFDTQSIPKRRQYADDLLILGTKTLHPEGPKRWTFVHGRDRQSDFIQSLSDLDSSEMPRDEDVLFPFKRNDELS
jgi:hypothetical protein